MDETLVLLDSPGETDSRCPMLVSDREGLDQVVLRLRRQPNVGEDH